MSAIALSVAGTRPLKRMSDTVSDIRYIVYPSLYRARVLVHSLHAQSSRASSAFFELRQGDIESTKLSIPKTFQIENLPLRTPADEQYEYLRTRPHRKERGGGRPPTRPLNCHPTVSRDDDAESESLPEP